VVKRVRIVATPPDMFGVLYRAEYAERFFWMRTWRYLRGSTSYDIEKTRKAAKDYLASPLPNCDVVVEEMCGV
jgi:hypothetical protein